MYKVLINFLFPPLCVGCGGYMGLKAEPRRLCEGCSRRLEVESLERHHWVASPGLDGLAFLGPYGTEPITTIIHKIKYQGKEWAVEALVQALESLICSLDMAGLVDFLVPVPLYPSRQRERGFNQADLIARRIAFILRLPCLSLSLRRTRPTNSQVSLEDHSQRRRNVRGAFWAADEPRLSGARILLVDDVATSGATLAECAAALRRAGAAKVTGFVLAGAIR